MSLKKTRVSVKRITCAHAATRALLLAVDPAAPDGDCLVGHTLLARNQGSRSGHGKRCLDRLLTPGFPLLNVNSAEELFELLAGQHDVAEFEIHSLCSRWQAPSNSSRRAA